MQTFPRGDVQRNSTATKRRRLPLWWGKQPQKKSDECGLRGCTPSAFSTALTATLTTTSHNPLAQRAVAYHETALIVHCLTSERQILLPHFRCRGFISQRFANEGEREPELWYIEFAAKRKIVPFNLARGQRYGLLRHFSQWSRIVQTTFPSPGIRTHTYYTICGRNKKIENRRLLL